MDNLISLTPAAINYIKSLFKENDIGFRLSIKKTGCSGYAYLPKVISELNAEDINFSQDNLKIYIDSAAKDLVKGLVIDYVVDNIGLKQKRLVYINPNEKNRCGCGESFTTE